MEPGTGLAILGSALGSAKVVEKILGPTADYLGAGLRDWTERGIANVGRVFDNARRKLGDKIEQPGAVPPKVLKAILQDAPFAEDQLAAEYFGGVLASSRSEVGRDDRGAAFAALVSRLTSYQIRAHYLFYASIKILYEGVDANLGVPDGRRRLKTYVPFGAFVTGMEFSAKENVSVILNHVMFGLLRESLVEENFRFGPVDHIRAEFAHAQDGGILFSPSALGVELFLWAHGRGDLHPNAILDPSIQLRSETQISVAPGIRSTTMLDRQLFVARTETQTEGASSGTPKGGQENLPQN
jgi:hypothetical protein